MKLFLHHVRHYLLPRESNNHRPRLLHEQTLLVLILLIITASFALKSIQHTYPSVLGITANISKDELLELTNKKRAEKGLKPLKMNDELASAAAEKAQYMFAKNFWAHIGPDGTTPWYFIKGAGYEYMYAGENLARGFTTAPEVVEAWMESPTHRENIMSPNYADIGFAVSTGNLTGSETVLVVEMFGTESGADSKQIAAANASASGIPAPAEEVPAQPVQIAQANAAEITTKPLLNSDTFTQQVALALIGLLIAVLIIDAIIIERKKIARLVAHNTDHIAFLLMILFAIIILQRGHIL
jgi:uncharacterized protein YkwD